MNRFFHLSVFLALVFTGFPSFSQKHFFKTNLVAPVEYRLRSLGIFKLSYENNYRRLQSFSIGIEKGYFERETAIITTSGSGSISVRNTCLSGISLMPEYRFYFNSPERVSTAFGPFVGVYSRVIATTYSGVILKPEQTVNLDEKSFAAGLGACVGIKKIIPRISSRWMVSGLFYELCLGYGYGVAEANYYDQPPIHVANLFLRLEGSLGYAF